MAKISEWVTNIEGLSLPNARRAYTALATLLDNWGFFREEYRGQGLDTIKVILEQRIKELEAEEEAARRKLRKAEKEEQAKADEVISEIARS